MLMRTPYGIDAGAPHALAEYLKDLADDGYLFAFQDIRGRYKSEGTFVMIRPPRKTGEPKAIDEGTDAFDTIDWLVKNVKENNGRVGMLGISYPGWLTVMALLEPHPALKAASPQAPPADMFLGDDFHHNGAFRLSYGFEYAALMETSKENAPFTFDRRDTFDWYLRLGPLSNAKCALPQGEDPDLERLRGASQLRRVLAQAGRRTLPGPCPGPHAQRRRVVGPGGFLRPAQGLRDVREERPGAEELPGGRAVEPRRLVAGDGGRLGPVDFGSATGKHFRAKIQAPWFAAHLKDRGPGIPGGRDLPHRGEHLAVVRSLAAEGGHAPSDSTRKHGGLSFEPPPADENDPGFDAYLSDPAHPVRTALGPSSPPMPARNGRSGWSRTRGSSTSGRTSRAMRPSRWPRT